MVAQSPPYALQNAQHSAALFRQAAFSPWSSPGVVGPTDLAVTAQTTPNMSVQVGAGRAWLKGTQLSNVTGGSWSPQGAYYGYNDAPVSLTVAAADPTNPRIDAVVAYVTDAFYSGSTNTFVLAVVTGTPAASPQVPTVPSNGLLLGTIAVAANATSIVSGNIASTPIGQLLAAVRGGYVVCTSTTRPTSPADGQPIFETDSRAYGFYEASSSKWIMYDTQWQTYTLTVTTAVATPWTEITYGAAKRYGRYYRKGREVSVQGYFEIGSGTIFTATSIIRFGFPPGLAPVGPPIGQATGNNLAMAGTCRASGSATLDGGLQIDYYFPSGAPANRRLLLNSASDVILQGGTSPSWNLTAVGHFAIFAGTYETAFEA